MNTGTAMMTVTMNTAILQERSRQTSLTLTFTATRHWNITIRTPRTYITVTHMPKEKRLCAEQIEVTGISPYNGS